MRLSLLLPVAVPPTQNLPAGTRAVSSVRGCSLFTRAVGWVLATTATALCGCAGPSHSLAVADGQEKVMRSDHGVDPHLDDAIEPEFTPAFYDHQETLHLDAEPDVVFPLFEPAWRRLWRPTWKQEAVFRRRPDDVAWSVDRVLPHHHGDGPEIFVIVTHLDPVAREIQYTIVWGGWEIQRFRITCAASPGGGTDATIRTMTYGLNDFGNREVTKYCEGGHVHRQNRAYVDAIALHLADESERPTTEQGR